MTAFADQLWEDAGAPLCDEIFGVSVVLRRAGCNSGPFTAIGENVDYQISDSEGFATSFTSRDYTFAVDDVELNGEVTEPRAGDHIAETINGTEQVFEIEKLGTLPAVNLLPGGFRWKVHTKRVA